MGLSMYEKKWRGIRDNMTGKRKPLVSVIVPYYNTEKFLERCVNSITSQTYDKLEIILVDDGSLDSSFSLAEKLAESDDRIRNISVPHGGVSAARNSGLKVATGEYLMFVDSDDWIKPDIISRMLYLMLKKDADIVTCELKSVDEMCPFEKEESMNYTVTTRDAFLRLFFKIDSNKYVHFPVAKLYKRENLVADLFPVGISVGEDVLGTYKAVSNAEKIVRLGEVGYFYYYNASSATGHFSKKDFDLIEVWDRVLSEAVGREPDHEYARINRIRVDFTLLLRMITELSNAEIKKDYKAQREMLRRALKANEKELMKSPIVLSRKVLIFVLCHFFHTAAFLGNIYVRLTRLRGKNAKITNRRLLH